MFNSFLTVVFIVFVKMNVFASDPLNDTADYKISLGTQYEDFFLGPDDAFNLDELDATLAAYDRADEKSLTPTEKRFEKRKEELKKITHSAIEWVADICEYQSSKTGSVTRENDADNSSEKSDNPSENSDVSWERKGDAYSDLCILPELMRERSFSAESKDEQLKVNIEIARLHYYNPEDRSTNAHASWIFCSVSPISPSCRKSCPRNTILRTISGTLIPVN